MKIWRFISALCIFSILLNYNYSVKSYDESNDDNITKNNLEYKSIDDLLRELKEDFGIKNYKLLVKKSKLRGIKNIGTYYYDDSKNKKNGEFDVVLESVYDESKTQYQIYQIQYHVKTY